MATLTSYISAGASAVPQSVLALECLVDGFGLEDEIWLGLVLFTFLLTALLVLVCLWRCVAKGKSVPRKISLLILLIDIVLLPSARSGLSALGCSDYRDMSAPAPFLNLAPWQACDASWLSSFKTPAVALSVLCMSIALTAVFVGWRLRFIGKSFTAAPISEWACVFIPLSQSFKSGYGWWFAVVLIRRMLLVVVLAFVPYYSVFLPLAFFAVIQLSALLQHYKSPFADRYDNVSELGSLYILLVNYFTSTVHSFIGSNSAAISIWFALLLLVNVAFILLLSVRSVLDALGESRTKRLRAACCRWFTSEPELEHAANIALEQPLLSANSDL